jgi:hypothetical protein
MYEIRTAVFDQLTAVVHNGMNLNNGGVLCMTAATSGQPGLRGTRRASASPLPNLHSVRGSLRLLLDQEKSKLIGPAEGATQIADLMSEVSRADWILPDERT